MNRAPFLLGCALALLSCRSTTSPEPEPTTSAICTPPPAGSLAPESATGDTLLVVVDAPRLSAAQEDFLAMVRNRATSAEVHVARTSPSPEALLSSGGPLILNVAPGRSFLVTGRDRGWASPDHRYWVGSINDESGLVTLVHGDPGITGTLQVYGVGTATAYTFEPLGEALLAVTCVDSSRFPPD